MLAAVDLDAKSASPTIKGADDAVRAVVSEAEKKSLAHVARVKLNEWH